MGGLKYIVHSKKDDSKDMIFLYDLIDKVESFLDEIKNCNSLVYTY